MQGVTCQPRWGSEKLNYFFPNTNSSSSGEHYQFQPGESLALHAANAFSWARIARILAQVDRLLNVYCPRAVAFDMEESISIPNNTKNKTRGQII